MARGLMADRPEDVNARGHRGGMFSTLKNDVLAMIGEFIGTVMFLLFALGAAQAVSRNTIAGTVTDSTGDLTLRLFGWWYISAAFGLSLFVFSAIFYRFTGSIFNPSVSLALCVCRVIGPVRFVLTAIAQMLGGIVASAILHALTPGPLNVNVRLAGDTNRARGVFIEMFATTALTLCVLMLAAEKSNLTPFAPLAFGMTLFVVMLFSIAFTGGAVNTARAFGPDVISGDFASYHWIYWLGPALGALIASGLYYTLKAVGYWRVNPDQDSTNSYQSNMAGHGPGATDINDGRRVSDATYANGTTGAFGNDKVGRASGANGAGNFGGNHANTGVTGTGTGATGMQTGNPTYPVGAQNV